MAATDRSGERGGESVVLCRLTRTSINIVKRACLRLDFFCGLYELWLQDKKKCLRNAHAQRSRCSN